MERQYWIRAGERIGGPYSIAKLKAFATSGKLLANYEISIDQSSWTPVGEIAALRDIQPQAPPTVQSPVATQAPMPSVPAVEALELKMARAQFVGGSVKYLIRVGPEQLTIQETLPDGEQRELTFTREEMGQYVKFPIHPARIIIALPQEKKWTLEFKRTPENLEARERFQYWLQGRALEAPLPGNFTAKERATGSALLRAAKVLAGLNCLVIPLLALLQYVEEFYLAAIFNCVLLVGVVFGFLMLLKEKSAGAILLAAIVGGALIVEAITVLVVILQVTNDPQLQLQPFALVLFFARLGILFGFLGMYVRVAQFLSKRSKTLTGSPRV